MNRNLLIPIVIIVLVVGGAAVWWSQNQTAEQNTDTSQTTQSTQQSNTTESTESASVNDDELVENYTVTLTNDGFEPSTLTVPAGTPVTFINQSDGDMWVASDPHPVHTDFSAFDQREDGDEYTFSFNDPGAYTYHNHLDESKTGLILVE